MRSYKKIFLIFFIFFFKIPAAYSVDNVAFIDMEFIIKNSNTGKIVLNKIKNKNNENLEKLKEKDSELKKKEDSIKSKKNILSKEELDKEIIELNKLLNKLREEKNTMVKEISLMKEKELNNFYKEVNPIIQSYMEENNIDILLDRKNIFIGKSNSNITENILKIINK